MSSTGLIVEDGDAAADALLAWCVGREVVALAGAAEGARLAHVAGMLEAGSLGLLPVHCAGLDALAA